MAKVRAYKIAEELELSRDEFLRKAAEIGITLRSAMVGVEQEQVEILRRRLGKVDTKTHVEKRIASGVIRRRRRTEVLAPPTESAEATGTEPVPPAESETSPPLADGQPAVPEPPPPLAAEAPPTAVQAGPAPTLAAPAPPPSPASAVAAELKASNVPGRKLARRKVLEGVTLKEQDQLSRSLRGNVQRRLEQRRLIVEQQSRLQSGRRRPAAVRRPPSSAPGPRRKLIRVGGSVGFSELSGQTGLKVRELLRRVRALGIELERDSLVDLETVQLLAEDIGFELQRVDRNVEQSVVDVTGAAPPEELEPRPPIVTVMGHVDHGKTTLLDCIRQTNVVDSEAGGITQHIGAYQAFAAGSPITFIDTPGHAAFTAMRARGAQLTDIVVLVVAADDGVMPQTVEAIDHARAANVPIVVAINKIDRPEANLQRVTQALLEHQLVPEALGGDTICVEVSAKQGTNVDKLLEMLKLQAEILELNARPTGPAFATVVEARLDRGRGPVATVLVREGLLKCGDAIVVGGVSGRIRTLLDDHGEELKEASPSMPVQIVGLSGVPEAGEDLVVVKNEREAKTIVEHRIAEQRRAAGEVQTSPDPADDVFARLEVTDEKELRLVVKADVRGTMEAICDSAVKTATEVVKVNIIHSGVGAINESDVMLAAASSAVILGFHIRPEPVARKAAERDGVEILCFDIVYELLDETEKLVRGLLPAVQVERISGHAEVRELFQIPRVGTVAGSYVPDGPIRRSDFVRVLRDGRPIYVGKLASLRRFKDDVREVQSGMECGMRIENFNDVKVGDILEAFSIEEVRPTG